MRAPPHCLADAGLKPKDVSKKLGRRFATSASSTKNASGVPCIDVGGDVTYELPEFMAEEFGLPEDRMWRVDKKGNRTPVNEF